MSTKKSKRAPGIEVLSDGRKRVRARVVDPRTGLLREFDRIVDCDLDQAIKLRSEWRASVRGDQTAKPRVPPLRDYVISWLRSKTLSVKLSTATTYADTLENHVLATEIADVFIDKLSDSDVRAWQAKLATRLAGATVNGALVLLKMVLADATAEFHLARNPASRVRRLPVKRYTDAQPNILTPAELSAVLEIFRAKMPTRLPLALTGARYGGGHRPALERHRRGRQAHPHPATSVVQTDRHHEDRNRQDGAADTRTGSSPAST
jgi:hypothetical protein